MNLSDSPNPVRTLNKVRAILAQSLEDRITEHEAIEDLIAEIERGFDVSVRAARPKLSPRRRLNSHISTAGSCLAELRIS